MLCLAQQAYGDFELKYVHIVFVNHHLHGLERRGWKMWRIFPFCVADYLRLPDDISL